jgi:putative transposase
MAQQKSSPIRAALESLLPRKRVREMARETGAVQRERKIDIRAFVWTLVLGFAAGKERTLAGLRRAFEQATGVQVVSSAFYDRFTAGLVRLMKRLVADVMSNLVPPAYAFGGTLAAFREVLVADSTVIRLHDLLARAFPACRTNHTLAAAKLHVVYNVAAAGMHSIRLTSERVHDGPVLRAGRWVRDRLMLFDLGYYRFQLFDCIRRQGGFFVSRLKERANPIITAVHRRWRGRSVPLVGERLQDVLARLQRQSLDVEVEVQFQRHSYGGHRSTARARFRLVGVRDAKSGRYHLYLTNVPVEVLSPEEIAAVYSARWIVELLFREMKASYRLEDMPSAKRPVVEALIYATILTLAASRALHAALARRLRCRRERLPVERWAIVFAEVADQLLAVVAGPASERMVLAKRALRFLEHEAIDPNVTRLHLLKRVVHAHAHTMLRKVA